ncbi:thioredoxin [Gordonia malaquae]|jgi:thioredoxin reductase (NADPH)|uniref:Thioredoxin n=1 Tax=Gordonia malaquae NBRC 108250 TaxID=1223542 RepID=M3UV98_GORML|nr:thioredoxin [Gordonia malaquae]GAC79442.1 thioredoxin [Gordonia malaquae NBRC 108250]SED26188.1 thioredoxin [Gordonia malaquae]
MATIDLTGSDFEQTIIDNKIVLVDFWAEWCGPCKQFAPTYSAVSEKFDDIVFAKVDTEAEQQLAAAASIRSIPTIMAFKDGHLVYNEAGALPPQALESLIGQIQELDVEKAIRESGQAQ